MTINVFLDVSAKNLAALPGRGTIPSDYVMVGRAPGVHRSKAWNNEPFGSTSMMVLSNLIPELPDDTNIYYTNLIKVPMSYDEKVKIAQIREYGPLLIQELQMVRPKRVLAFGTEAAQVLCPSFKSMREDHGTLFANPQLGCIVMPTYQLSSVKYDKTGYTEQMIRHDFERFFKLPDPKAGDYQVFSDEQYMGQAWKFPTFSKVYLDIETSRDKKGGYHDARDLEGQISMIGIGVDKSDKVKIITYPSEQGLRKLLSELKQSNCTLIGHNMQFDLYWLMAKSGVFWDLPIEDTMLMAHVAGEPVLSLKHLTTMHTWRAGSRAFGDIESYAYNAEDVLATREIYRLFDKKTYGAFARDLLNNLVGYMAWMRLRGVPIDRDHLQRIYDEQLPSITKLEAELNAIAGRRINWNSNQQIIEVFQTKGAKLAEKTSSGQPSVKESVLLQLAGCGDALAMQLLKYRETVKQIGFLESYLEATSPSNPYLYPRLKLHGTETGRLSCEDPNLQQVPRVGPLKLIFGSRWPGGKIGLIDLSQAELRVAAMLSNDPKFTQALLSEDVHRTNAAAIFRKPMDQVTSLERKKSKGVTFGLLYGGSPGGLADRVGVSVDEVKGIVKNFFDLFPVLHRWIEDTKSFAVDHLYIETPTGRKRDLRGLMYSEGKNSVERKAVNTPVQGTASDIAIAIFSHVLRTLQSSNLKSFPLFGVHDSIIIEIYPGEEADVALVVAEGFMNLRNTPLSKSPTFNKLPLVGDFIIGDSWAAVESTNEYHNYEYVVRCSSHQIFTEDIEAVRAGKKYEGKSDD